MTCEVQTSRERLQCNTATHCPNIDPGENPNPWRVYHDKDDEHEAFPDLTLPYNGSAYNGSAYKGSVPALYGLPCLWLKGGKYLPSASPQLPDMNAAPYDPGPAGEWTPTSDEKIRAECEGGGNGPECSWVPIAPPPGRL